jgi:hypothetical protein
LYTPGSIEPGMPRVMQRSNRLKSSTQLNTCSVQLLLPAAASFLPSSVAAGIRPLSGQVISEAWRSGSPRSVQWPMPIFPTLSSWL